ncbi:MAG: hypothetical protein J7L12_03110, partial [Desulfurococcales archaeon]|nr:hypothetical protein [Desulfurococcales archaeon]
IHTHLREFVKYDMVLSMLSITQQKILLALLRAKKPVTVRKLMEYAGIQYNIRSHLEYLSSLDLIKVDREVDFPRRKLVTLTSRGRAVANLIKEINTLLNNTEAVGEESKAILATKSRENTPTE